MTMTVTFMEGQLQARYHADVNYLIHSFDGIEGNDTHLPKRKERLRKVKPWS